MIQATTVSAPTDRATRLSAAAVVAGALPSCLAFGLLLAFVFGEASGVPVLAVAPPANVAEAAAYGDAARMLALMSGGQDVSRRWPTRPGLYRVSIVADGVTRRRTLRARHA